MATNDNLGLRWGKYRSWLENYSEIIFRKKGETEWISAIVYDDRFYPLFVQGDVHHVTMTSKGSIDFIIDRYGMNSAKGKYEIKISECKNMDIP